MRDFATLDRARESIPTMFGGFEIPHCPRYDFGVLKGIDCKHKTYYLIGGVERIR